MQTATHAAETVPLAPAAAPAAIAGKPRTCPECGSKFHPPVKGPGQHKRFCEGKCRIAWANREKAHGAVLITVAKIWRAKRGGGAIGKAAFAEMTTILDVLLSDDRQSGRPSLNSVEMESFAREVASDNYIDRKRFKR
jgi:hypothetical protein